MELTKILLRAAALAPFLFAGGCVQPNNSPVVDAPAPRAGKARQSLAVGNGTLLQTGLASWYGSGKRTANGERFVPGGLTAAHPKLGFGTRVRVVNEATGRSVVVRINDRGPFVGRRVIDLSRGAARAVGVTGVQRVSLYAVADAGE